MQAPFRALICGVLWVAGALMLAACEKTIKDPSGLEHRNPHFRRNTAVWFGESNRGDTVTCLSSVLKTDIDVTVRAAAAESLGRHGDLAAVPVLRESLTDKHPLVRSYVIDALSRLRAADGVGEVQAILVQDPDGNVRKSAANYLGAVRSEASLEALVKALDDGDSRVRFAACRNLGAISGEPHGMDAPAWRSWWSTVHE